MHNKEMTVLKDLTLSTLLILGVTAPAFGNQINEESLSSRLNENHLIYTTNEMSSFNVSSYLQQNAPHLTEYADVISHWSGYSSISPRLVIALIEYNTGAINNSNHLTAALDHPMGQLSQATGFSQQIKDVTTTLAKNYYQQLEKTLKYSTSYLDSKDTELSPLAKLLANNKSQQQGFHTTSTHENVVTTDDLSNNNIDAFKRIYFQLFPDQQSVTKQPVNTEDNAALYDKLKSSPPTNFLQLPFPVGEYWWTGRSHSQATQVKGSQPSLGFHNHDSSTQVDTAKQWVVAAAPGKVIQHSDCSLEVVHDKGWSTVYYNLTNIQVSAGQFVNRNEPLANYTDSKLQGLCQNDSAASTHQQQFSVKQSGRYVDLNGVQLSNYTINISQDNNHYDDSCNNFWLIRDETKYCAGRIYNHGIDQDSKTQPLPTTEPMLPPPISGKLPLDPKQAENFFNPSILPGIPGLPGLPDIIPMSKLACQIARAICNALPGINANGAPAGGTALNYQAPLPGLTTQEQQPQPQGAMPNIPDICPIINTVCGIVDTLPGMHSQTENQ